MPGPIARAFAGAVPWPLLGICGHGTAPVWPGPAAEPRQDASSRAGGVTAGEGSAVLPCRYSCSLKIFQVGLQISIAGGVDVEDEGGDERGARQTVEKPWRREVGGSGDGTGVSGGKRRGKESRVPGAPTAG